MSASNKSYLLPSGSSGPSGTLSAIAPGSSALAIATRGLYIGGAGDLVVTPLDGGDNVTFVGVPAGTILPIRVSHVLGATTATGIIGLA